MAGDGPSFRTATADDAAAVLDIKRTAIREIAGWTYSAEQVSAWAPDASAVDDFEAALEHDGFVVVVAEAGDSEASDEGVGNSEASDPQAGNSEASDPQAGNSEGDAEVVGYGVLATERASIDAVYVHPDHTGEGIATSLVRQLETRARMCGLDELTIVSSHNASPFYESLGYWHVDETDREIDGVTVTFDVMRKSLDSNWPI